MFARRRDFLYKRSQNGAHLGLAARLGPTSPVNVQDKPSPNTPIQPPDPKTSPAADPFTLPGPQTTNSPTTPPPAQTTPALDSPSPSSSSPSSASALASASSQSPSASSSRDSSSAHTTLPSSTSASASLSVASPTSAHVVPSLATQGTQGTPGISFTAASSVSPTSTSTPGSSGGTNTGAIVGGIAGTLAGIAVLGFLLMWCMRRQRNQDIDDFDAQAFRRQSAVLVDDPVEPTRSYNPRPPTMIERHNASPALAAQAGHGGQNFYGSYGGYNQQSPYPPLEMIQSAGSPPPQAYGAAPAGYAGYNEPQQPVARHPSNGGYPAYDGQQQLARQPSNPTYLTRQPSAAAGFAPPTVPPTSLDPNAQYIDLNRSSVSPYQAAQYADISRQLGAANPNTRAPPQSLELPDDPLPSPFDDPVGATPGASHHADTPSNVTASGHVAATSAPETHGNATELHQRPSTVYEEGDAYGGI